MKVFTRVVGVMAELASPAVAQAATSLAPFNVVVAAGVAAIPASLTGKFLAVELLPTPQFLRSR